MTKAISHPYRLHHSPRSHNVSTTLHEEKQRAVEQPLLTQV